MQGICSLNTVNALDWFSLENKSETIQPLSPTSFRSPSLAAQNPCNDYRNDSTPRAKFLKAVADDRSALHACTIEDLARYLQDADSAVTSEAVLKAAISLANNEIRDCLARAEDTAKNAIESADQANCTILALKMEHTAVVEALISAQRDEMASALENEQDLMQHIAQLEKRFIEENQSKFELKSRIEELEHIVQESSVKLSRLDGISSRASSMEKAVKESWDRVTYTESKLKDQQEELAQSIAQLVESQSLAKSLESSLNVAEANIITNREVALKEKQNFENTITQLRLDLNLSREAVERARSQTDGMIEQLAHAKAEKCAIVQSHAASMEYIFARSSELESLHNAEMVGYSNLEKKLKISDAAISLAESRANTALKALDDLKDEHVKLCAASKNEATTTCEVIKTLESEIAALKLASQAKDSAAILKEASMNEEICRLQSRLQDDENIIASSASTIFQLEEQLIEKENSSSELRKALENCMLELSLTKMTLADLITSDKQSKSSAEVPTQLSIANGLDEISKSQPSLEDVADTDSSNLIAMVHAKDSMVPVASSVQSSQLSSSVAYTQNTRTSTDPCDASSLNELKGTKYFQTKSETGECNSVRCHDSEILLDLTLFCSPRHILLIRVNIKRPIRMLPRRSSLQHLLKRILQVRLQLCRCPPQSLRRETFRKLPYSLHQHCTAMLLVTKTRLFQIMCLSLSWQT
jgi:hypothetical protein